MITLDPLDQFQILDPISRYHLKKWKFFKWASQWPDSFSRPLSTEKFKQFQWFMTERTKRFLTMSAPSQSGLTPTCFEHGALKTYVASLSVNVSLQPPMMKSSLSLNARTGWCRACWRSPTCVHTPDSYFRIFGVLPMYLTRPPTIKKVSTSLWITSKSLM